MRKISGNLLYSPSDLVRFMESPFASWMSRYHLECPGAVQPDEETEEQKLVARFGDNYEIKFLSDLRNEGKHVVSIPKNNREEAYEKTSEAIKARAPIIYQACLRSARFEGYADFLVLSSTGGGYDILDTNSAARQAVLLDPALLLCGNVGRGCRIPSELCWHRFGKQIAGHISNRSILLLLRTIEAGVFAANGRL